MEVKCFFPESVYSKYTKIKMLLFCAVGSNILLMVNFRMSEKVNNDKMST